MAASTSPSTTRPAQPERRVDLWWPLVLAGSAVTAYLTLQSLHLAAAVVSVVLVIGLYAWSRTAGLAAVWLLWLLLPEVRRVFDLVEGYANADPLAVAPFVATGAVAAFELTRSRLSTRAKVIVFAALAGFVFGAPLGLQASPKAGGFALVAYVTGVLAFVLGYREPVGNTPSPLAVLAILAAPLSIYGILQSLAPLTPWDASWLQVVGPDFLSIGSKEAGTLRVFSTLNSPGTFAIVLALAIVALLAARRLTPARATALVVAVAGLALTLVRSAWIALGVALILLLLVAPGPVFRRVLAVVAVGAVGFAAFAVGNPAVSRVTNRATTVSNLSGDRSAQERLATPQALVPQAISQPLGNGLGSAGEASRLSSNPSELRATDNALLSLMFQLGPVGFILVLGAFSLGMVSVVRNARHRRSMNDVLVFGCMALLTVLLVTGDVFYGVTGAIIWYLLGFAVRGDESRRTLPSTA